MNVHEIPKISRSASLNDELYHVIKQMIIECKIKPQERINIESISKALGVSRTPLREALQCLKTEGLISFVMNRGPIVNDFSLKEVEDAYSLRLSLEYLAISKAIENFTNDDIGHLKRIISDTYNVIQEKDYNKIVELNKEFHFTLYQLSNNFLLERYMRDIFMRIERATYLLSHLNKFVLFATDDHEEILECLTSKDLECAKETITKHLTHSYQTLKEYFEEHNQ